MAEVARIIPSMVSGSEELEETVLVFELISDAVSLWSHLESEGGNGFIVEAARALGHTMGTVHRVLSLPSWDRDPRLSALPRSHPWAMTLHRPAPSLLAGLSPAGSETLRILQTQGDFAEQLKRLCEQWQPRAVVHGDIRFDNVLIRPPQAGQEQADVQLWITDWEMIQFGDPAWDVAGALQDFLVFWVSTMPLSDELAVEQMIDQAAVPLAVLRGATRAMWSGYRRAASLGPAMAEDLLRRAVVFSAARLVQSAFEVAQGANVLPGRSVLLLQISANLLVEPEGGQLELYGIPLGSCLP